MSIKHETILSTAVHDELIYTLDDANKAGLGERVVGLPDTISGGIEFEVEDGVFVGLVKNTERLSDASEGSVFVYVYVADIHEHKRIHGEDENVARAYLAHESEFLRALSRELSLLLSTSFDCSPDELSFSRVTDDESAHGIYYAVELHVTIP